MREDIERLIGLVQSHDRFRVSVAFDGFVQCRQVRFRYTDESIPVFLDIFIFDWASTTTQYIPRETLRRVSTPQAYRFDLLDSKYHEAFERGVGIDGFNYTNTMMVQLGIRLNFAAGSDRNIKLTTPENLEFFRAWAAEKGARDE